MMKKLLISFIAMFAVSVSYAGNNDIYITQSGTGLTMNIDQIGDTNKVGTSQTRATIEEAVYSLIQKGLEQQLWDFNYDKEIIN